MQTAQILGGYTLGGADLLRRAMGKKKPEEMAQHRSPFRDGAAKKRHPRRGRRGLRPDGEVRRLRLQQEPRRSLLPLLAYHTAWLKVHHRRSSSPPT